jgi:predicted Zn-dependent protease with MMP-like domain
LTPNRRVDVPWKRLQKLALDEIDATLDELPGPLREPARRLPVIFEHQPNAALQAEGIAPDTLGLFTGADLADPGGELLPPQIILYLDNLWDFSEGHEETFLDEVHTTYLHELGHYLGLDEDDLTERGLE